MSEFTNYFRDIFIRDIPLIDVRAECEFEDGHFLKSINLPLMNDNERDQVGKTYKKHGQEQALKLGHELVSGSKKQDRIEAWFSQIKKFPESKLYCFRGGLRSSISVQWIKENGGFVEKIPGGYKALRNFLLEEGMKLTQKQKFFILAARTGSGKTKFLRQNSQIASLDLELWANHRGSSFGYLGKQDSQISFENNLIIELMKKEKKSFLLLEDESQRIGHLKVPDFLFNQMQQSSFIELIVPIEERIDWIIKEYVEEPLLSKTIEQVKETLKNSLYRLEKKLGGLQTREIFQLMDEAFKQDSLKEHSEWVRRLLTHHYDPIYDFHINKVREKILFSGDQNQILEFLKNKKDSI
jgi:tRNA 2-selenouridine synthase